MVWASLQVPLSRGTPQLFAIPTASLILRSWLPSLFHGTSQSGDSADGSTEPIVDESEWVYFGRQIFRTAILQLLSMDLTAAGKKGQAKGGSIRKAKRLLIARDPRHCCEAIRPMLQRQGPSMLPSLLREHHKLICHDLLENDTVFDTQWRAQSEPERKRTAANARRLLRRLMRHLRGKARQYLEWAVARLLQQETLERQVAFIFRMLDPPHRQMLCQASADRQAVDSDSA